MRNHSYIRLLAVVVLSCTVARAGDGPLLEQLQEETRALTEAANKALVRVSGVTYFMSVSSGRYNVADFTHTFPVAGVSSGGGGAVVDQRGNLYMAPRVVVPVYGVLVGAGAPSKLVVSHEAGAAAKQVTVTFADGTTAQATLIDADAELGVAVYSLPVEIAAKWPGLEVAARWQDVAPGTLGLDAGSRLGLTLVREADRDLGTLEADAAHPQGMSAALVGSRKRLLGLARMPRAGYTTLDANTGGVTSRAAVQAWHNALSRNARLASYTIFAPPAPLSGTHVAGPVIARVLDDIAKHGAIRHAYLGIVLGGAEGGGDTAGVVVSEVLPGSPAAEAGLEVGHRILSVNGMRTTDPARLTRMLVLKRPGEQVALEWRGPDAEVATKATVTLGDRAEAQDGLVSEETLGMTCMDLGPELRRFMGLADEDAGVVVKDVREDGAAYRAGVRRGDVIVWGGGAAVSDLEELRAVLAAAKGSVQLHARRPGAEGTVAVVVKIPDAKRAPR